MGKEETAEALSIEGREVRVTHPNKLYYSKQTRLSKLDLVRYYLSVAPAALGGIRDRPLVLKRFVNGAEQEAFYQKRAPTDRPPWLRTVTLSFPSGRTAEELVVDDAAGLAWIVNLGCIELHPHPVRSGDLEHPDELRVDLDPGPGVSWADVCKVALEVKAFLEEVGLRGWPKTSGSRGMHVNVRIEPRWTFTEVRRAALALSRAVERRAPSWPLRNGGKRSGTACFSTTTRTRRTGRHARPIRCARCRMLGSRRRLNGTRFRKAIRPISRSLRFPKRFAELGDPHARNGRGSRFAREVAGIGGSKTRRRAWATRLGRRTFAKWKAKGNALRLRAPNLPAKQPRKKMPLLVVANSPDKEAALAGLERWKSKHAEAAGHLAVDDVLVDSMRGRSSTWTRIRVNLRNVPEALRPAQETPDPDDDPTREWRSAASLRKRSCEEERSLRRQTANQREPKISNSSCGGTTSSCA